jgi:RNA polymerase sigma factor for flagellar operon FliA
MSDADNPESLFLEHLGSIERAIRFTCRRASLREDEAQDFASYVKLKLIEKEYAILRKHDQRASFEGFISVVVQHLFLDYRITQWGKWHASAEAKRHGDCGVTIEAMLCRDGRSIEEVIPLLQRRWPELTRQRIEEIAGALPRRIGRPRAVDLEAAADEVGGDVATVFETAFAADRMKMSREVDATVRSAMEDLEERDRLILRLKYEGEMSVADIARTLKTDQKPLYRRLQRALAQIRARLERKGIGAEEAEDLLSSRNVDFDFGFGRGTATSRPSNDQEES